MFLFYKIKRAREGGVRDEVQEEVLLLLRLNSGRGRESIKKYTNIEREREREREREGGGEREMCMFECVSTLDRTRDQFVQIFAYHTTQSLTCSLSLSLSLSLSPLF